MKTCENEDCKFYHKDLVDEGLLDTEFENTGEEVEICKWCGHLAYYKEEEKMGRKQDKEQPYIFVDNYGDLLAQVNDMELVEYKEEGSYQGEYLAILKAPASDDVCKIPERLYYYFGYYGSCCGCDWLESEDEMDYDEDDTNKRYKINYKAALEYAQQSKPVYITPATVKLKIESISDWEEE